MDRRQLLKTAGLGVGAGMITTPAIAEKKESDASTTKMKFGSVTYNIAKDWSVDEIIQYFEEAQYEGVELRTTHAHKVEVDLSKEEREDVKKRFEDSKVELVSLGSAYDYHTPDQQKLRKDIEATKEYIVLAHDVGCTGMKVRPNALPEGVPKEKTLEQIGKSLREIGIFGQEHGIKIWLEVHGRETSLLPNIKTIMDVADHEKVGVCWNCNHNDLAGEGFDYNFNLVKDKIFLVHLKELSNTNYPYRKLFQNLNRMGYEGYCMMEISGMSNDRDTVRFMKYLRTLWLAYQNIV